MNVTEQKIAEKKKAKEEHDRQMIADYKAQYRRVTGQPCPEVEIKKAWIKVGNVSFRPDEFSAEIEILKSRPEHKNHISDLENIRLFSELNARRVELVEMLNKTNSIQGITPDYFVKINEFINKAIEEINDIIERKVLFE